MHKVGKEVMTPDGVGTVVDLNILKDTVRVRIPKGDATEQKDYPAADVQRLSPAPRAARPKGAHEPAPAKAEPVPEEPEIAEDAAEEEEDGLSREEMMEFAMVEGLTEEEAREEIAEMEMEDGADDLAVLDGENEEDAGE